MANYEVVNPRSIKATIAIANQYVFVNLDSNGQIVLPVQGGYAIGVTQDKPSAGDPSAVCRPGDITNVLVGSTFAAGADVSTDSLGQAVAATSAVSVLGMALTAGVQGYLAVIIYQPKGAKGIL